MSATPTQNESFPLPGYEDRLWAELEQLHEEEYGSSRRSAPAPASGWTSRRRYLAVVGGVVAAAVVGVFAVFVREDGTTRSDDDVAPVEDTNTPPTDPAADPAEAPKMIVVSETRFGDGLVSTTTADEETGTSHLLQVELDGSRGFEDFNIVTVDDDGTRTGQQTSIDHVAGEYTTFPSHDVVEIRFNHQMTME